MLGQCVGDALGFLVEGLPTRMCCEYVASYVLPVLIPPHVRCDYVFGQYSDDSQLARETLIATVQNGGVFSPVVFGLRMALMFQPGAYRIVGYGQATARACEAMWRGGVPGEVGCANSTGNGSAMRSAPLGWMFMNRTDAEVAEVARVASRLTHASETCQQGAAMMAVATKWVCKTRHEPFDLLGMLRAVANLGWVSCWEEVAKWVSAGVDPFDKVVLKERRNVVVQWGLDAGEKDWGKTIACGVKQSVVWALYCFSCFPDDYVKCVALAIAVGGDVDTTAAMAGALCGARVGVEGIPRVWVDRVNDKGEWTKAELTALVEKVAVA